MPPDRRSIRSRCSDGQSRKGALQFFVDPPYDSFPGPGELRHPLVLLERDRRDGLIFGRASRNFSLDSVSYIDEELPHAVERGSRLLRIVRDGPMPRHEDISIERSHRIEHSNPERASASESSASNTSTPSLVETTPLLKSRPA